MMMMIRRCYWNHAVKILPFYINNARVDRFNVALESWNYYQESLEQYFAANGVVDAKKMPVLLSVIGGKTYTVLHDITADTIGGKTYDSLVHILTQNTYKRWENFTRNSQIE